ncbi:hypothetical protein BX070DRAFT_232284 [Coemansia spiralis]|nr:hypothetical protein BX070DRAFT_232284 [Coemansia spiralis]
MFICAAPRRHATLHTSSTKNTQGIIVRDVRSTTELKIKLADVPVYDKYQKTASYEVKSKPQYFAPEWFSPDFYRFDTISKPTIGVKDTIDSDSDVSKKALRVPPPVASLPGQSHKRMLSAPPKVVAIPTSCSVSSYNMDYGQKQKQQQQQQPKTGHRSENVPLVHRLKRASTVSAIGRNHMKIPCLASWCQPAYPAACCIVGSSSAEYNSSEPPRWGNAPPINLFIEGSNSGTGMQPALVCHLAPRSTSSKKQELSLVTYLSDRRTNKYLHTVNTTVASKVYEWRASWDVI